MLVLSMKISEILSYGVIYSASISMLKRNLSENFENFLSSNFARTDPQVSDFDGKFDDLYTPENRFCILKKFLCF